MAQRKKVLQDHRKRGSRLVTPFNDTLGPLGETSWIDTMIPELLWISLIQHQYGHRDGVQLITSFTRTVRAVVSSATPNAFASMSSYASLSPRETGMINEKLMKAGHLEQLRSGIHPLTSLYPFSPLKFLDKSELSATAEGLSIIKECVTSLYPRDETEPMMVQATAIWLGFDSGLLKVAPGLALAKFPEIEKYPRTELSRRIGASIRAGLNGFFGSGASGYITSDWPSKFWTFGREIEPCNFDVESQDE